ncbi:VWFA and cache domain-containing protein 1, partial [Sarcoptes scabiei]
QSLNELRSNLYPSINVFADQSPSSSIITDDNLRKDVDQAFRNDINKFGAYSKLINKLMSSIVEKELGASFMEQNLRKTETKITMIDYDTLIDEISEKMIRKLDDIHSALESNGETIVKIFHQHLVSNIAAPFQKDSSRIDGCCDLFQDDSLASMIDPTRLSEMIESTLLLNGRSILELNSKFLNELKQKEQEIRQKYYHRNRRFDWWTTERFSCDISLDDRHRAHFFNPIGPNLTERFRLNLEQYPTLKWQYFLSFLAMFSKQAHQLYQQQKSRTACDDCLDGSQISNDKIINTKRLLNKLKNSKKQDWLYHQRKSFNDLNQLFAQRHREMLLNAALPHPKLVVLVIDRGSALTEHQLMIAKSIAKFILSSLSYRDRIGIVDLASEVHYPSSETCSSNLDLAFANYEIKHFFAKYIDEMERSNQSTNHHLGFEKAFQIIANNYEQYSKEIVDGEPEIFIPYISRGFLSSLTDAKSIMQLIANELIRSRYSFRSLQWNFKKFNIEPSPSEEKLRPGLMITLNSTENLDFILNGIYTILSPKSSEAQVHHPYFSLPYYDFITKETIISLSKAFYYRDRLIGVTGADLSFYDLIEDIAHYDSDDSYAFLLDRFSGKLLYHPVFRESFEANYRSKDSIRYNQHFSSNYFNNEEYYQNLIINVDLIERIDEFVDIVKPKMMATSRGMHCIRLNSTRFEMENNRSSFEFHNNLFHRHRSDFLLVYRWRRILSSPFVIVIVSIVDEQHLNTTINSNKNNADHYEMVQMNSHRFSNLWLLSDQSPRFISHRLDYRLGPKPKLCKHFNQLATIDTATLFLSSDAVIDHYKWSMDGESFDSVRSQIAFLSDRFQLLRNPGLNEMLRNDVNGFDSIIDLWKSAFDNSDFSKYVVRKYIATKSGALLQFPGALMDQSFQPKTRPWYSKAIANPGQITFTAPYLDIGGSGYIVTLSRTISKKFQMDEEIWAVMGIDLTLGYLHKIINDITPICARSKGTSCFLIDEFGNLIAHSSFFRPNRIQFIENQHITHRESQLINHLLGNKHVVRKLVCNSYQDRTMRRYYMFNTSLDGIVTNFINQNDSSCAKYMMISLTGTNAFFGMVDHQCDNLTTFCPCSMTDRLCLNCHRMEEYDCECPCECPLVMNLCNGQLIENDDRHPICAVESNKFKEPSIPKHLFESLQSCVSSNCFNRNSENDCKGVLGCEWCTSENGQTLKKPFCGNQNVCFGGVYGLKNPYINFLSSPNNDHRILQSSNDLVDNNQDEYLDQNNLEPIAAYVQSRSNNFVNDSNYANLISPYQVPTNYRRRDDTESDYGYSTMVQNKESEVASSSDRTESIMSEKCLSKRLDDKMDHRDHLINLHENVIC